MRQTHIAGERLFAGYAGQTVAPIDAVISGLAAAQIFVATLGASSYACATARQTTADWIGVQVRALECFGGVPYLIVPDRALLAIRREFTPTPPEDPKRAPNLGIR